MLIYNWFQALTLTVFISISMAGYGTLTLGWARHWLTALALGIGIYTHLVLFTGLIGFYSLAPQLILALMGWALFVRFLIQGDGTAIRNTLSKLCPQKPQKIDALWLVLPGLYFLARFFSCGLPQQHSDPLYYHLAAPKFWATQGRIILSEQHPSFSQSTLWEVLYGLSQIFLVGDPTQKNITTQLVGQWLHLFWGHIASVALAAQLLKDFVCKSAKSLPVSLYIFIAWICLSIPSLEWTSSLAKNDYLVLAFILAALVEIGSDTNAHSGHNMTRKGQYFRAGLFLGLAYSIKLFALWTAVAFIILLPLETIGVLAVSSTWGVLLTYGAGFIAGIALIVGRNLYFTGNPLFPGLSHVFGPNWVSNAWNTANASFIGPPRIDWQMLRWISEHMFERDFSKVLLGLGTLTYSVRCFLERRLFYKKEFLFLIIQTFILLLLLRHDANGRYSASVVSILFLILAANALLLILRQSQVLSDHTHGFFSKAYFRKPSLLCLPLLMLGLGTNIPLDVLVKLPRDYLFAPSTKYLERFHYEYSIVAWLNQNLSAADRFISLNEKIFYYLNHEYEAVLEMRFWERILSEQYTLTQTLDTLKAMGYRYAHLSRESSGYLKIPDYQTLLMTYKNRAAYSTDNAIIFDLTKPY